jgi:hypothetical protein
MVLLESGYKATEIKKEIRYLRQLEALGIKTPRRYKKITLQQALGDPIHKDWDFLKIFFVNV